MQQKKLIFKLSSALLAIAMLTACAAANNSNSGGGVGVVSSVTVTNTIETSGSLSADKLASLKWGTTGVVDKVNVKVGALVKINDVLASLRLDSVPSDVVLGQSNLATAQRDLQNLLDSNTSLAQAQLDVVNARADVETAQNNWEGMAYPRATDALIKNTQAKIWDAEKRLTLANKRYKEVRNDPDGDPEKTAAQLELTDAQLDLNELTALYNWYVGKPTQADYDEAKAKLDLARAAWEDAKRQRDIVKSGTDPLKIAAAQGKVDAYQATVNTMYIIAPFDGEILSVQTSIGNSAQDGQVAVEIVDRTTLKIETLVDESSITSVTAGNPATITFDSLPGVTLTGKVTGINRIGQAVNGLIKYTVIVSVDPTDKPVLFGATANVVITTGEPHTSLAVPVLAVMNDSNGEYVLVLSADGNSVRRVAVQSGDLSGNLVTITTTEELKEGDQVELGSGTSSSSNNGGGFVGPGGGGGGFGPGGG